MTLKLTTAIQKGKLNPTKMEVGESFVGILKEFKAGPYGSNFLMLSNGQEVEVFGTSGNLKYVPEHVAKGKLKLNVMTTITRKPDYTTKNGYNSSAFDVLQTVDGVVTQSQSAPAPSAPTTQKVSNSKSSLPNNCSDQEFEEALAMIRQKKSMNQAG